jgi:uncharacterized protein YjbI with pentapeptide repeats
MQRRFLFVVFTLTVLLMGAPLQVQAALSTTLAMRENAGAQNDVLTAPPVANPSFRFEQPTRFSVLDVSTFALAVTCFFFLYAMRKRLVKTHHLAQVAIATAQAKQSSSAASPISDHLVQLCHKNQLLRLNAIQHIGDFGMKDDNQQRAVSLLAAYVRAITNDHELRAMAKAEIYEALSVISQLITISPQPLSIYLAKSNLSGLFLRHLSLSGADFSDADFSGSVIEYVNFDKTVLDRASFARATLESVTFKNSSFVAANWASVSLHNVVGVTEDDIASSVEGGIFSPQSIMASFSRTQPAFDNTRRVAVDKSKLH